MSYLPEAGKTNSTQNLLPRIPNLQADSRNSFLVGRKSRRTRSNPFGRTRKSDSHGSGLSQVGKHTHTSEAGYFSNQP